MTFLKRLMNGLDTIVAYLFVFLAEWVVTPIGEFFSEIGDMFLCSGVTFYEEAFRLRPDWIEDDSRYDKGEWF